MERITEIDENMDSNNNTVQVDAYFNTRNDEAVGRGTGLSDTYISHDNYEFNQSKEERPFNIGN
jgi:hypothetical protein